MPSISSSVSYPITQDKGGTGLITQVLVGAQQVIQNAVFFGGSSSSSYIGQVTLNAGQCLIGSGTAGLPHASQALTAGQIWYGTSGDPSALTLVAGANITITSGSGTLTIASTGPSGTTPVTAGGTGLTSVATNALLVGAGASPLTVVPSANNSFLITDGLGAPSFSTTLPTAQLNSITSLPALTTVGTIATGVWNGSTIDVTKGGTGLSLTSLDTKQMLVTNGTGAMNLFATNPSGTLVTDSLGTPGMITMTNGQVLIGSSGSTPTAATLTAGTGINVVNSPGSITIEFPYILVISSVSATLDAGHIVTASGVTITAPAGAVTGNIITIIGDSNTWIFQTQNDQTIGWANIETTPLPGNPSFATATDINGYDAMTFVFREPDTWIVVNATGSIIISP